MFRTHPFLCSATLTTHLLAALLEGLSFSIILLGLSALSGQPPSFLPNLETTHLFLYSILAAVILQILRSAFSYAGLLLATHLTMRMQSRMQEDIYSQIFRFPFPQTAAYKRGDLIHLATAPPHYLPSFVDALCRISISALMGVACFVLMCLLSWQLAAGTLLFLSLTALAQRRVLHRVGEASATQTEKMVALSTRTTQHLEGLKTLHLFYKLKTVEAEIRHTLGEIAEATFRLKKWNHFVAPFNEMMGVVLVGVALGLGMLLLKGRPVALIPALLIFLTLTYRLATRLQICMQSLGELAHYSAPLRRVREFLQQEAKAPPDEGGLCSQLSKSLTVDDLTFFYPESSTPALTKTSLEIPKGKIVALVGPSGAGKSTLLDLLLRLYEPTEGRVLLDGISIKEIGLKSYRALFGVVGQDTFLFNDTIARNISFGAETLSQKEIERAAKQAQAHTFITAFPEGYHTVLGERGYKLSGGEKQRIALARALVRSPEILVLDEATSSLDSASERAIQRALLGLKGEVTMVIVAHRLSTIAMADLIYVLDQGKIKESGTHEELMRLGGRYHLFWSLQAHPDLEREPGEVSPISF